MILQQCKLNQTLDVCTRTPVGYGLYRIDDRLCLPVVLFPRCALCAVRRGKLKAQWNLEQMDDAAKGGDRDDYIREGLEQYDGSVRRKLILGVYIIPTVLVAVIIYLTNFA